MPTYLDAPLLLITPQEVAIWKSFPHPPIIRLQFHPKKFSPTSSFHKF